MRLTEFLTEGQKYENMFNGLRELAKENPSVGNDIKEALSYAKTVLKRKDRIDWYLRWERFAILFNFWSGTKDAEAEQLKPLLTQYRATLRFDGQVQHEYAYLVTHFKQAMKHHLSMNLHAIETMEWSFQSPTEIRDNFEEFEAQWRTRQKQIINYEEGDEPEVFIDLGKGWAWYDLDTQSCDKEGAAMGHCGNAAGNYGETVLSLRHRQEGADGRIVHRPSLTFILKPDGSLGEMKGRANEKPKQKYHAAIEALLRDPRITGITGGGYAANRNFKMGDLAPNQRAALVKEKPDLRELHDIYEDFGDASRADGDETEKKEKLAKLESLMRTKLNAWLSGHSEEVESVDFYKDEIVYEKYADFSSYSQNWNGFLSFPILSMFQVGYQEKTTLFQDGLIQYYSLGEDDARKVNDEALRRLKPFLVRTFISHDIDFYDSTFLEMKDDGSIIIQGELVDFVERYFGDDAQEYSSYDSSLVPYVGEHDDTDRFRHFEEDSDPLVREIAIYVRNVGRSRDIPQKELIENHL